MSAVAVQPYPSAATQDPAEAASRLFAEHSKSILAYCLRQLGSRSEAEDAVQTTFMYALRGLRRGVVPECEAAWLTTIARNVCHWQRRTVARRGPLASDIDLDTIGLAQPDGDEEHLLVGLKDALASIPENQRRAIVLREWHGVAPREIATELGMSAAATHALLTRARHSLAQALTLARQPALGVVWALVELRSHLKALLAGVSTKAAVATVAVVGVGAGVGGVAIDKATGSDPLPRSPVLVNAEAPVGARSARGEIRVVPVASVSEAGLESRQSSQRRSAPPASTTVQSTPPAQVLEQAPARGSDPASDPQPGSDRPQPQPESLATLPLVALPPALLPTDPLPLPQLEAPTDLQPAVDLPPLPAVKPPAVDVPSLGSVDQPPAPPLEPLLP